jgi:putative tricarboxylic transport membrane protein
MIGLFALAEVFFSMSRKKANSLGGAEPLNVQFPKLREVWPLRWVIAKSAVVGSLVGVVPGHGAALSAIIAYNEARRSSKNPDQFGKGSLEGVAAPEAANNSCVPAALIPLLGLGIPGTPTTAIMMGALMMHKVVPGPELFKPAPAGHPEIVYGLFVTLLLSFVVLLAVGMLGNRVWVRLAAIPENLIYLMIICFAFIGSYFLSNSLFDVGVCLAFGSLGWFLKRNKFPTAPIILGLILGKLIEENLRLSLVKGGLAPFFTRPLSGALLLISIIFFVWPLVKKFWPKSQQA